jgi:hypothetical protein
VNYVVWTWRCEPIVKSIRREEAHKSPIMLTEV